MKISILAPLLLISINAYSDNNLSNFQGFFQYYEYDNYKSLTFNNWEQCVINTFKEELGEFLYITSISAFIKYLKKREYKIVLKFLAKTTLATTLGWINDAYIIGKLTYIAGNCAYLEWE